MRSNRDSVLSALRAGNADKRLADLMHALGGLGGWSGPEVRATPLLDGPAFPSLQSGAIHEWMGRDPPVCILVHAARRLLAGGTEGLAAAWVGRCCWPRPWVLGDLLSRSLFVDGAEEGVWAADLLLRCPGVGVVVLDAAGLRMCESRRLQLAAQSRGAAALLARPRSEARELSAAATRWAVHHLPSPTDNPRWNVELLRCKGTGGMQAAVRRWDVEWDCERRALVVPAGLAAGPGEKIAEWAGGRRVASA